MFLFSQTVIKMTWVHNLLLVQQDYNIFIIIIVLLLLPLKRLNLMMLKKDFLNLFKLIFSLNVLIFGIYTYTIVQNLGGSEFILKKLI